MTTGKEILTCNGHRHTLFILKHLIVIPLFAYFEAQQKHRGMFETHKSRNKTNSGEIGLSIRTLASPKVGQDQVSGGESVICTPLTRSGIKTRKVRK